jgi:hypothetical protein
MEQSARSMAIAQSFGHIAGDDQNGDATHGRLTERSQCVCRAWAAGHDRNTETSGGARQAISGIRSRLLVSDADYAKPIRAGAVGVEVVPERQVVNAGQPEHGSDTERFQRIQDPRRRHLACHPGIVASDSPNHLMGRALPPRTLGLTAGKSSGKVSA